MHVAFLNPQGNFDREDSYLTEHADFGGQLVYVKELSLALARSGVQVDIVTRQIDDPDWPGFSKQIDYYTECQDRLRILRIPFGGPRFLEKETLWPHIPEFVDNLLTFYGDERPDYLTAHYADGGYSAGLLQAKTGLGFTFTGHSLGAQKMDKLDIDSINNPELEKHFHFSRRIDAERLAMQRADTVVTSTRQERFEQYAHALYAGAIDPTDDSHFAMIPPGVNTDIFSDTIGAIDEETHRQLTQRVGDESQPYVLVSSRLDEKKNIIGVVKAYAESTDLRKRTRLALCVRGMEDPFNELQTLPEAEQAVLRPILETIDSAAMRHQVDFFNILSQQQLASTYRFFARRGSVFVLSSFYEPFGLAPIEAAACGLPVVATKNGGPSEIFANGSALLVDPEDPQDIATGILTALDHHARYAKMGKDRVLSRYTWSQTARDYMNTIEKNMQRPRRTNKDISPLDASARITAYLEKTGAPLNRVS